MLLDGHWLPVADADPRAWAIFRRHYSFGKNNPDRSVRKFVGIGTYLMLLTVDCDALFLWRAERVRHDGQTGIGCAVFRNESTVRSSDLIREADALAWRKWPGERHFTYVDPGKIRSTNPGYCFLRAGYTRCGTSKSGLVILERIARGEA